jgi:hypothetical protein
MCWFPKVKREKKGMDGGMKGRTEFVQIQTHLYLGIHVAFPRSEPTYLILSIVRIYQE